ncbi:MAG: Holliday junction branch migration protein RuvA [Tissierellia bacterium]|nr:Holliday junction branch migration protein RuvA [Tissierellia bacterium]
MFEYLDGSISYLDLDYCALDVGGVGFKLHISQRTRAELNVDEEVRLFTYQHIRENIMELYGFLEREEREIFLLLLTVSGIGPKVALAILSHFSIQHFLSIIQGADHKSLTQVPGIGQKTAQRLILELKDKVKDISFVPLPVAEELPQQRSSGIEEVRQALKSLGYGPREISFATSTLSGEERLEEGIKLALMKLSKV